MRLAGMVTRPVRYAARAGMRAGTYGQPQSGPPARFGVFGTTVCLLFFTTLIDLWWREVLIGLGVTVFFALPLAYAVGKASLARKQARGAEWDSLDDLMAKWDEEGRR